MSARVEAGSTDDSIARCPEALDHAPFDYLVPAGSMPRRIAVFARAAAGRYCQRHGPHLMGGHEIIQRTPDDFGRSRAVDQGSPGLARSGHVAATSVMVALRRRRAMADRLSAIPTTGRALSAGSARVPGRRA